MNERSATALTIGPEQVAAPGDAVTHAANDASAPKRVVISLRDVRKSYTSANGEKIEVLRGVNLDVEAGEDRNPMAVVPVLIRIPGVPPAA